MERIDIPENKDEEWLSNQNFKNTMEDAYMISEKLKT